MFKSTVRQPLKYHHKSLIAKEIKATSKGRSYVGKIRRKSHVKSTGIVLSSSATVYNNAGWIISSIGTYNLETGYTYNVFGETPQTRRELVDGRWMVSERVYDSQGRVIFSTDSHVEGTTDPIYGTRTIYDSQGRVEKTIRYVGCQVAVATDGTSTVVSYGNVLYQTSTEYDSKGRVKSSTDAYGNVTTYEYDNLDRQVAVNHPTGLVTQTIYDTQGRFSETRIINGSEIRTTKYEYDMFGNIVKTIQPDGTTIQAEYNDKGQKISETNQLGQTRYFEYDDNAQLVKVTLPMVNGVAPVYEYTYDSQGNQLTIKDPNGNVTRFTYDVNGNQLTRTLPDGSMESFEYDKFGRLAKQTSFEGIVTTYYYDSYGRLETKKFFDNQAAHLAGTPAETWTYTYDTLGRVTKIDPNGRVTQTVYDAQGRTVSIQTPEGSISYTYDEFGRQASVQTDNDPSTCYTYDQFGRLAGVARKVWTENGLE